MRAWHEEPNAAVAFCIALDALRDEEGAQVSVLCENPDPDSVETQSAVEVVSTFTGWKLKRFYGRTPLDAILAAAAEQARSR